MTTNICRSFRQDFPQFVEQAGRLGVSISLSEGRRNGRERVFWLDAYKQLTGFDTKKDGRRFTLDDAAANIAQALASIEQDRAVMAGLSVAERFQRVMHELRQIKPQYRMIGEVRLPGGDRAHCFFMADYDGGVNLHGMASDVSRAKAAWRQNEAQGEQLVRFCDALEADFALCSLAGTS